LTSPSRPLYNFAVNQALDWVIVEDMKKNELGSLAAFQDGSTPEGYFGNEKKWEIVKAAAGLFIKRGTVNTGVRDIAEASGITVGTLYHYFKSKEEIIASFMDFAVLGTEGFRKAAEDRFTRIEPHQALKQAMGLYMDFTAEAQNIVLFWHQETRNLSHELRQRLLDNEYVLADAFERIIKRGQQTGIFKVKDSWLAAHNVIIMCDMWAFRRWALGRRLTAEQFKNEQIDFIFAGLYGDVDDVASPGRKEVKSKK
jgi:TetR/AcrR family transcriptional regulator, cholesterol catabolism regulator